MSRRTHENVICAVLLAFFALVIWLTLDFGPRARMIPLPLAIFGIVLTVAQLLWQNLRATEELQIAMISVAVPPTAAGGAETVQAREAPRREKAGASWRKELAATCMVGALLLLILVVGLLPAVFVFTGGYFIATRQYSWRASLLYATLLTVSLYLMFVLALQIEPYHGLLAPVIGNFN